MPRRVIGNSWRIASIVDHARSDERGSWRAPPPPQRHAAARSRRSRRGARPDAGLALLATGARPGRGAEEVEAAAQPCWRRSAFGCRGSPRRRRWRVRLSPPRHRGGSGPPSRAPQSEKLPSTTANASSACRDAHAEVRPHAVSRLEQLQAAPAARAHAWSLSASGCRNAPLTRPHQTACASFLPTTFRLE